MKKSPSNMKSPIDLGAFSKKGELHVIIETPKGNRNKFKYDEKKGLFKLSGVLPEGSDFPFDFGFVPSTIGEDGDPLDVLVLMDEPAFVGCLIPARLIGAIQAEQSKKGKKKLQRNDRLIAVARDSHNHTNVRSLKDLNKNFVKELEHFFVSYNEMRGKKFKLLGCCGPKRAQRLLREGIECFTTGSNGGKRQPKN